MKHLKTAAASLSALAALAALSACAPYESAKSASNAENTVADRVEHMQITGKAAYRERIALLPGAVFTVKLEDVSRADAPSVTLAEYTRKLNGEQVPFAFTLRPSFDDIRPGMHYSVRATITGTDGKLAFTTDTIHPIDTQKVEQDMGILNMIRVRR